MKVLRRISLLAMMMLAFGVIGAMAQNVMVNPGAGSYATLSAAFAAINAGTHTGAVTVSIDLDTTEPAAGAILNASGTGSASYTSITITPNGVRTVSGATTAGLPLIDLNGADNVTINGGGTLTITNTTVSTTAGTSTIRFINDATGNTIQNVTVNGAATGTSTATILYSTTTGTTGNDGNIVNSCNIGPVGATFPLYGIQSIGTTTSQATRNSGIQITNNNIFDFFNAASVASGILASGSTDWTITGNSFYQTGTRTFTAAGGFIGISIADTSGVNFVISNNFVGGNTASAGGTAWTQTGAFAHTFIGIRMSVGTATASSLQNNVIRNLSISTSTTAITSAGISAVTGAMNIGTTTGNTIGATTGTGSITWTGAGTAAQFAGILAGTGTPGGIAISNNNIGSITVAGAGTTTLYGIRFSGTATNTYTISGNTIGSITTANSITSNSNLGFVGISGSQTAFAASVTNNTVQNLQHTSTGTAASLRGIELLGSVSNQNIAGNTIANFSTASTNTTTFGAAAINGIVFTGSATTGNTITANTIRDLASTTAGATAVYNNGIIITSTPGTTMNRNFIFNLSVASTSTAAAIQGIYLFNSSATENIVNNMMRLGTGLSTSINPIIRGIRDNSATSSPTNIFFNSIFIDGVQGGATVNTACISREVASTMDLRDNILWNNRASTGAPGAQTGRHYAILNTSTTGTFTSNYNDLYTPNNGGAIGQSGGLDRITLANWQTATSQDVNSINSDPLFIDATNATAPNLHIQTGSPARNLAINVGVANDFDNENRPGANALFDIGADEADGVAPLANDIAATAIVNPANGASGPIGITTTPQASFTNVGTATQTNVQVQFTITGPGGYGYTDTQTIATIAPNQTVTVSFAVTPAFTTAGTYTSTATVVTADGNAANNTVTATFTILAPVPAGNVNVPGDYPSLTNAGGVFAALNAAGAAGNIVINITADLTSETGANALNPLGAGITVTINPSGGATRLISGSNSTNGLLIFNGADRVNINGLNAGGNALIIRNTGAAAAILYINDASDNILQNSQIEGGSGVTLINIASGLTGGTGNDNIQIINNIIRDQSSGGTAIPFNSVGSTATSTTVTNSNLLINNNQIFNFTQAGVLVGVGTDNITVTNNNIYQTAARTTALIGVAVNGAFGTNLFSQNQIHDLNTSVAATGMTFNDARGTTVSRNNIYNFPSTSGSTGTLTGIVSNGSSTGGALTSLTIVNNFVSIVPSFTNAQTIYGIEDFGFTGNVFTSNFNSVLIGGTASGSNNSYACVRLFSAPTTYTSTNNICFNNRTGGTGNAFAAGDESRGTGTFVSNYNIFVGTGATAANYFDLSTSSTVTPVSFTTWQAGTPTRDANSQASNPGGNYTAANIFVSTTDLHLNTAGTNPALGTGNPVAEINADYDNDLRDTVPDIGADEIVTGSRTGTIPAGTYRNGNLGASTLGGDVTFTGNLTLSGIVTTNANTLTVDCNGTVSGAGSTNFVVGNVRKNYCAAGTFTYPVGDNTGTAEYSPMTTTVTALGTVPSSLTVSVTDATLPGVTPATAASRYWTLTEGGDLTANLSFNYVEEDTADVSTDTDEANYRVFKLEGSAISDQCGAPCVDAAANIAGPVVGVTEFSRWGIGSSLAPTAADGTISGRVISSTTNRPLENVTVKLSGGSLVEPIIVYTDQRGRYNFTEVPVNAIYTVTVESKRHLFYQPSTALSLTGNAENIDFYGEGR